MILLRLVGVELWREIRLARSYLVDFVADQVLYTLGFLLLSGIFQLVAQGDYRAAAQLDLLVGYFTWRVADGTLLRLSRVSTTDAQWGTLEQLWLTPLSPRLFLLGRMLAIFVYQTGRALLVAIVVILLLRLRPIVTPAGVLVFLLAQSAIFGVGFMLVGLQLLYKNISAITLALSTALLFLTGVLAPLDQSSLLSALARFLPLTTGISLLREYVVESASLSTIVMRPAFLWLVAVAAAYGVIGLAILDRMQRAARQQGALAHY
jgi:ABC-2 type transport system permease protein